MDQTEVVATFAYRHEGEFARETLRAGGIDSILVADDAGGAYAGLAFTRRAQLLVSSSRVAEAKELLVQAGAIPEDPASAEDKM